MHPRSRSSPPGSCRRRARPRRSSRSISRSRKRFQSRAEHTQTDADDAVQTALRLLRHRDRSVAQLMRELESRGVDATTREQVIDTLARTGLVDDVRFAERRAAALALRNGGDALIRHDLTAAGIAADLVEGALASLEGEHERAARIVERRGASPKTARYLAGKGFSSDVAHAAVARAGDEALG